MKNSDSEVIKEKKEVKAKKMSKSPVANAKPRKKRSHRSLGDDSRHASSNRRSRKHSQKTVGQNCSSATGDSRQESHRKGLKTSEV